MSSSYRSKYRSVEIVTGPAFWPTVAWALGLVLVQASLAPLLAVRSAFPSLGLITVILFALRVGARRGGAIGLAVGIFEDILAGTAGAWTIATTAVALGAGGITRRFSGDGFVMPVALCGAAVLARDAIFWAIERIEGYPAGYATAHVHSALWRAALTALAALVYLLLRERLVTHATRIERS